MLWIQIDLKNDLSSLGSPKKCATLSERRKKDWLNSCKLILLYLRSREIKLKIEEFSKIKANLKVILNGYGDMTAKNNPLLNSATRNRDYEREAVEFFVNKLNKFGPELQVE